MSFPRLIASVYLNSFHVEESGFASAPYIFDFDIAFPRPAVNDRSRTLVVDELPDKETEWSDRSLRERMIFKEIVEGPVNFGLSIYPAESGFVGQLTDLVGRLGSELISNYVNLRFSTINALTDTAQEAGVGDLQKSLESTFAIGDVDFSPEEIEDVTLEIPLIAPEQIKNPRPDPTPEDNRPEDDHQEVLKETGESNGYVKLRIELTDR